jgi:hypothetical protein
VNAVNLLPAKHRPRTPTGGQQGSSYVVIGVLGALLLMVLVYGVTVNGINDKRAAVTRAKTETEQATKRAAELAPYGNFIQVKQQRVDSVKSKAIGRIDWERLALGLGAVLPEDVWLTKATATTTGTKEGGAAAATPPAPTPPANGGAATPAPPTTATGEAAPAPEMTLSGCAPDHIALATTLVRLKHLPSVTEVTLTSATKPADDGGAAGGGSAPGAGASGGDEDCGRTDGKSNLRWSVTVTFRPQAGSEVPAPGGEQDKVPTSLGGGA